METYGFSHFPGCPPIGIYVWLPPDETPLSQRSLGWSIEFPVGHQPNKGGLDLTLLPTGATDVGVDCRHGRPTDSLKRQLLLFTGKSAKIAVTPLDRADH